MKSNSFFIPSVLTLHYWFTLIRLLISLAFLVIFVVSMVFSVDVAKVVAYPILALLVSTNDILMLTLDFKRTGSYAGTVLAQTVVSALFLAPPATFMGLVGFNGLWSLIVFIPSVVHILCTLHLSITLLLLKREAGDQASWKSNTKDLLLGCYTNRSRPSWFGRTRNPLLKRRDVSKFTYFWVVYMPNILFRRIRPVESKRYAVFQNMCALFFIAAITTRAVMALAQAQNQIETRSGAEGCYSIPSIGNLRVLVRHRDTRVGANPQTGQGYDVGVQVAAQRTGQYQCTSEVQHGMPRSSNWFQVFNCGSQNNSYTWFSDATYNITIHSTNGTSLDVVQLPDIWFANLADTYQDKSALEPGFLSNVAPWLVPPWQLFGGKHVEASVGVIERRFITSSVFRDIIANMKPTYESVSIFTAAIQDTTPLADNFTASALVTPSSMSSLSYLNDREGIRMYKDSVTSMPRVCAYIEDYRSSTIFDAIGSIGGLLAILQSVHILLFGRPMFWGIAGAKLISPFGIFGRCHSREFRRRLREHYHHQPTGEPTDEAIEAIRINTFLRDFVVDFGPADVEQVDVEAGRNINRHLYLQPGRSGSSEGEEHRRNNSLLLSSRSKADRKNSEGSHISMETMSSRWEP